MFLLWGPLSPSLQKWLTVLKRSMFDGYVPLTGKAKGRRPVKILRDTASIPYRVLPSGLRSDGSAAIRGIEMGFVPAPLHATSLQSPVKRERTNLMKKQTVSSTVVALLH